MVSCGANNIVEIVYFPLWWLDWLTEGYVCSGILLDCTNVEVRGTDAGWKELPVCSWLNVPYGLEWLISSKLFVYKSVYMSYSLTYHKNHDPVHRAE